MLGVPADEAHEICRRPLPDLADLPLPGKPPDPAGRRSRRLRAASATGLVLPVRCREVGQSSNRCCSTRRSACSARVEAVSGAESGNGLLELLADIVETIRF